MQNHRAGPGHHPAPLDRDDLSRNPELGRGCHKHSIATLAHAVAVKGRAIVAEKLAGLPVVFVPYARPGLPLTQAIMARVQSDTQLIVLENHGLIYAAQRVAKVAALMDDVDARLALGIDPHAIARIGVDATSGSMVLTDAALRTVTRSLMYNAGGFVIEAARVAAHAPDPHITRDTGSALARELRLVAEDGGGKAVHLLHQADFIAALLMGTGGWLDENNALKTGHDAETGRWPDWLGGVGMPPGLVPVGAALQPLAPDVAAEFGLNPMAMVHACTTDSIAAFLAAVRLTPGLGVTSLGTTLAVKLLSDRRIDAPNLGLYSHKSRKGWLVSVASTTGGGVLLQFFTPVQMTELSQHIDPQVPSRWTTTPCPGRGNGSRSMAPHGPRA